MRWRKKSSTCACRAFQKPAHSTISAPADFWNSRHPPDALFLSAATLAAGIGIGLGAQRQPDRRARQVKLFPQAIDQISAIRVGKLAGARGKQNESRRARFWLRDVIEAETPAAGSRWRMCADGFGEEAVERRSRHTPIPDRMALQHRRHQAIEPCTG